jgi:hypothetical protein
MSDDTTPYTVVPFNPLVHDGNQNKELEEKRFIRERILNKSNQAIVQDMEAMEELCALGSDLNINAFACNFRINGQLNEDVEDANYLNNRIFDRLSVTHVWEPPREVPLYLSSTIFSQQDYGECVRNYQRRMGLETESRQDLFVLRNVVMSPFQGVSDYPRRMAEIFEGVLREEVQNVLERATVSPQKHFFTVQGHDKIHLVYHPLFHKANGRTQLILSADFSNSDDMMKYKGMRHAKTSDVFTCETMQEITLDAILQDRKFQAMITAPDFNMHCELINIQVIKRRGLESRWRDQQYPERNMPFYLYGTPKEAHIEHMLLRAPNVQINADLVKLKVTPELTKNQLAKGVIMQINRPERALQPPAADNKPENMFKPGATFEVTIMEDVHPAHCHGPGLTEGGKYLAKGEVTLGKSIYVDWDALNKQDFAPGPTRVTSLTSHEASQDMKEQWKEMVRKVMKF